MILIFVSAGGSWGEGHSGITTLSGISQKPRKEEDTKRTVMALRNLRKMMTTTKPVISCRLEHSSYTHVATHVHTHTQHIHIHTHTHTHAPTSHIAQTIAVFWAATHRRQTGGKDVDAPCSCLKHPSITYLSFYFTNQNKT